MEKHVVAVRSKSSKERAAAGGVSANVGSSFVAAAPPGLPPGRRWWFRLIALIGVPLVLAVVLEVVLRVSGYGYPTSFLLERQVNGQTVWIDNQAFGKRFFPAGLVRYPKPMTVPVAKTPGTIRIFVFGESAAMGDPDSKFGLPRMLEVLLQARYPEHRFEVVNAAMVAINSHVILPMARECAGRQGDLWVIFMGNNEIIGPFGSMSRFGAQTPPRVLVRTGLALKRMRVGQLLESGFNALLTWRRTPQEWGGMTMWADQKIAESDPRTLRVYQNFEANLDGILEAGCRVKVPIVLCTVANNLKDCGPFGSLHTKPLNDVQLGQWNALYQDGIRAEAQGRYADANTQYERAMAIDPDFADVCFRRARCCLALGQVSDALQFYRRAREQDALQFRTNDRMNEIIRQRAAAYESRGVQLLDADEIFATNSPNGLPGQEWFYEQVHLTPEGNYLLARAVAERTASTLGLKNANGDQIQTGSAGTGWLGKADCLQAIGFTDWNRHDLLTRIVERVEQPPFTQQVNHAEHLQSLRQQIEQLRSATKPNQLQRAAKQVAQAVSRRPDDADLRWNLAQLLDTADDVPAAEAEWREVIRLLPQANLPYFNLARLLETHGRLDEALALYELALRLNPDYFEARYATGVLLTRLGQPGRGLVWLRRAVGQRPMSVEAHWALGMACQKANRAGEAAEQFREVLRLDPGNQQARQALGGATGQN